MKSYKEQYQIKHSILLCAVMLLFPVIINVLAIINTHAAGNGVEFSVSVPDVPVMEITLKTNELHLDMTPQMASADFKPINFEVTVGTSNKTGYTLNMNATSTNLTRTEAISGETPVIATLDSESTVANFASNRWGFRLGSKDDDNPTYLPVQSTFTVASNDEATNGITSTLAFAAKVDGTQPAGLYTTTLNFVATANPTVPFIQDVDSTMCTTTASQAIDSRDNQVYTIKKLDDGKCWMMNNLNLGAKTLTTDLTSSNTNLSDTVTAATFNDWKKSTGTGSYTSAEYIPVSGSDTTSKTPYGTLYNYCAASAGTICTSSNYSNASYDLCPAGWRLPTGNTTGEFQALYGNSSYNTNAKMRAPESEGGAAFALAGYFIDAAPTDQGSDGNYWSSTRNDSTSMYSLNLSTSSVDPADYGNRYDGYSIRCVLKDTRTINDVEYLQDINVDIAKTIADNTEYTKKDKRDNQNYTFRKLADGKVWMTKNLNLAGSKALSADNTDVTSTYISGFTTQAGLTKSGSTISLPAATPNGTSIGSSYYSSDSTAYVTNATSTSCGNGFPCYSYYSWIAATLGGKQANGSTAVSDYYNAAASICPKGWRLPTSTTSNGDATASSRWKTGDFYALATAYGANLESNYVDNSSSTGKNFYNNAGPGKTPNFLLTGYYYGGSFDSGGSYGNYWSSTSYSSTSTYYLAFNSSLVYSAYSGYRRLGFGVRCILRES